MSGRPRVKKGHNPYEDHINLSVTIMVEGHDADQMFKDAKVEAAAILNRPIDRLYVQSHTPLQVGSSTKYRANLAEPSFVESWKIQVTVAVKPDEEGEDNGGTAQTEY